MWNQYPPPSYAAYIWTQGDKLSLAMPGLDEASSGHKVAVEIDSGVLRNLLARSVSLDFPGKTSAPRLSREERKSLAAIISVLGVLSDREHATKPTISTPGAPTQHDLDAILAALKAGRVTRIEDKKKITEELSLEDLGDLS